MTAALGLRPRQIRGTVCLLGLVVVAGLLGPVTPPATAARTSSVRGGAVQIPRADTWGEDLDPIAIPAAGPAGPYPATISVPVTDFVVSDVDVFLSSFDHPRPDDVDVMLAGPGGQQVTLMSDAGGSREVKDGWLRFDDEAATPLPDETRIADHWATSYRPGNYGEKEDPFPDPAPRSDGNASLSVFDGTNPTGNWRLFVADDTDGESGSIFGGWALEFHLRPATYPSEIEVSGLPPRVTDLDVDLDGLSLAHPEDVDLLLVGPGGQQATLVSDAGGTGAVSGVDLTLDDEAGAPLDAAAPLTSGRFRPTNLGGDPDAFPEPAPASSGKATLSTFDGTDPNGTWSLYVVDDGDPARPGVDPAGALSGWSLDIETDDTPPTGTVRINAGAATTSSTTVSLDVSADDPGSASTGVTQVRFSNDGKTYSEFRPYFSPAAWTLTDGDGVKTVYAQFRDASGNVSVPVSDTITLRSVAPPSTPTPTPTATPTPAPAPLPAPVDRRGPRATMFVPVRKADGVSRMTRVDIQASEALAPASVNHRTVFLRVKGTRENVRCTVAYRGLDHVIVIEPSEGLTHHTTYLVKVKAGVTDLAGNGWDQVVGKAGNQPLTTQFTTA